MPRRGGLVSSTLFTLVITLMVLAGCEGRTWPELTTTTTTTTTIPFDAPFDVGLGSLVDDSIPCERNPEIALDHTPSDMREWCYMYRLMHGYYYRDMYPYERIDWCRTAYEPDDERALFWEKHWLGDESQAIGAVEAVKAICLLYPDDCIRGGAWVTCEPSLGWPGERRGEL